MDSEASAGVGAAPAAGRVAAVGSTAARGVGAATASGCGSERCIRDRFEARKPKGQAVLAEISGTMQIAGDKQSKTITIHDQEGNYREYVVSARAQLLPGVSDGCEVKVGQQLTKGSVNPHDLLRLTDPNTTLRYIVGPVQGVYDVYKRQPARCATPRSRCRTVPVAA